MTATAPRPAPTRAGRTPVMADVARLAGVSHQTVSRVINGHASLRPATRARVEEAIRELGYRPNTVARALVTKRSATLGVIATNGGLWGPSTVHRAIQAAARESGYFVSSVNLPDVTREDLGAAVEHLRDHNVEGIVMIAANDEAVEIARRQETGGVPVVVVEGDLSRAPWTVGVDQVAGARLATEHLLSLGHEQVMHVAGPQHWEEARARLAGWSESVQSCRAPAPGATAGRLDCRERLRGGPGPGQAQGSHRRLRGQRPHGHRRPACPLGGGPLGARRVQRRRLRRHPRVGLPDPPLTTVRQDFDAVGRLAIDTLQVAMRPDKNAGDHGGESRRGRLIKPGSYAVPAPRVFQEEGRDPVDAQ